MKNILVVDDDPDILFIIHYILSSEGFNVKTHPTGLHVSEVVESSNPNIILLDINLPGKSGTAICKELKHTWTDLPVIFISAHAKKSEAFAECKADDFISKPFEREDLVSTIKYHLINDREN